jgi:hypothetical protein
MTFDLGRGTPVINDGSSSENITIMFEAAMIDAGKPLSTSTWLTVISFYPESYLLFGQQFTLVADADDGVYVGTAPTITFDTLGQETGIWEYVQTSFQFDARFYKLRITAEANSRIITICSINLYVRHSFN